MAEEPDNRALQTLRAMRAKNSTRFHQIDVLLGEIEATLKEVRLTAIGHAAYASRGRVDLRRQTADLRVEKLGAGR